MGVLQVTAGVAVLVWAATLSVIDIRERRLPNALTLGGAAVMPLGAAFAGRALPALAGGAALGALYLVVHVAGPSGLGAGDVKLALSLGALTGALGIGVWTLAALAAPMITAVAGVLSAARGHGGAVPHGPAMCGASLAVTALVAL